MTLAPFVAAAVLGLAVPPSAAQGDYLVRAEPRTDFERCIVEAWTRAVAPARLNPNDFTGKVETWTRAGGDGAVVVFAEYYNLDGGAPIQVRASTRIADPASDAVTDVYGEERVQSLFRHIVTIRSQPTGLDQDIVMDPTRAFHLEGAANHVVGLYQPAARACRAAALAARSAVGP